ncbi:YybH family protein [Paracidobacterium acidisoli]|uniref:Nuclear transport factor 2 family protein n=1 Tax=Paracidobacterium acidisoli TaxID=2303751 RepID=A0A372IM16_9BACT|nr:nuclear transport factor 2 family protein [Paracidobacterium acidisoli]MBT9331613.1 nuclear transport factor 2 family protein [Paracidobacterium acidisoli]
MTKRRQTTILLAMLLCAATAFAGDKASILQVLTAQETAWNRGDIDAFMKGYQDSPETTFIGQQIARGYQPILDRYRHSYPGKSAMGILHFSELQVRMLGAGHAVVTGHFHLARTQAGGGDTGGIFSLVFEKEPEGWRIILDHTTVTTKPAP